MWGGKPEPRTVTRKWDSPPILTSEHRLGPRDYGHHHGLLVVLPLLAFECHLEAVERGALGLQGHGAAWGGLSVTGRRRTGAQACAQAGGRLPPRAAPSPPPAGPACDGRVWASPRPRASGPRAGRAQSGALAPRRSLLWRLIVGARPACPLRARPRLRAANRAWPRPGHAAPLETPRPAGGGQGSLLPAAPRRGGGGLGPAGEDPELPRAGSVLSRPAEPGASPFIETPVGHVGCTKSATKCPRILSGVSLAFPRTSLPPPEDVRGAKRTGGGAESALAWEE